MYNGIVLFMEKKLNEKILLLIAGSLVGLCAVLLVVFGNPKNMGFCIACFIRDIAGATKMHSASVVQYMRPEIIGLVLGSFLLAVFTKEFKPRGGSSPMIRLVLGALVMIGALAFLGCPLRMVLRLAGGDLNALVAFGGFAVGIGVGVFFLNRGFSLGKYYKQNAVEGLALPFVQIVLFVLLIAVPGVLVFSEKGPGSMHAPIVISLVAGLLVGAVAQRSRLCMAGGIRDVMLFGDTKLLFGFIAIFVVTLIGNLITGNFSLSFSAQPVAHSDHVFNFLGMMLCGLGSALLGGCPLRQLILAGEGNTDSALSVVGMFIGATISHNFGLAGVANTGVPTAGRVVIIIGLVICCVIGLIKRGEK